MPDELEDLTDEMKAAIGQSSPPVAYEVSAPGIRLFARAVGYEDEVYYDEDEAKRRGHRALPAPPGFYGLPIFNPGRAAGGGGRQRFQSPFKRILNGGTEVEPIKTVYAGDVLAAVTTLKELNLRSGSMGQMLIQTSETVYTNQDGDVVAKTRGTGISY